MAEDRFCNQHRTILRLKCKSLRWNEFHSRKTAEVWCSVNRTPSCELTSLAHLFMRIKPALVYGSLSILPLNVKLNVRRRFLGCIHSYCFGAQPMSDEDFQWRAKWPFPWPSKFCFTLILHNLFPIVSQRTRFPSIGRSPYISRFHA